MKLLDNLYTITASNVAEGTATYDIHLNADNPIYSYHFPDNPITPGVCILQIATELAEIALNRQLNIKEYGNVKYLNVISPVENPDISVQLSWNETETGLKLKGVVSNPNGAFTKISATY